MALPKYKAKGFIRSTIIIPKSEFRWEGEPLESEWHEFTWLETREADVCNGLAIYERDTKYLKPHRFVIAHHASGLNLTNGYQTYRDCVNKIKALLELTDWNIPVETIVNTYGLYSAIKSLL